MDGFLDLTPCGRTELRIHGVSGTPPDDMLGHPHPRLVAGDGVAGFYRRWWPGGRPSCDDRDVETRRHREAYSWGGLTSGAGSRALWLLLLPFMLLNVAFYMTPRPPLQDTGGRVRRLLRRVSAATQRLLALTLTGSLVLSVSGLTMDLVGWQCGQATARCGARHGWLGFLTSEWLGVPHRQLAVTSLVPAAVVVLLWYLGRKTWQAHELTRVPRGDETPGPVLLEDRATWNGGRAVGRLRAAHVTGGFSLVAVLLLAPLARRSGLGQVLLVIHLLVMAAVAAAVTWFHIADRSKPSGPAAEPRLRWVDRVSAAAAVLYLGTAVLVFHRRLDPSAAAPGGVGGRPRPSREGPRRELGAGRAWDTGVWHAGLAARRRVRRRHGPTRRRLPRHAGRHRPERPRDQRAGRSRALLLGRRHLPGPGRGERHRVRVPARPLAGHPPRPAPRGREGLRAAEPAGRRGLGLGGGRPGRHQHGAGGRQAAAEHRGNLGVGGAHRPRGSGAGLAARRHGPAAGRRRRGLPTVGRGLAADPVLLAH